MKSGEPIKSFPIFIGWNPSTSLSGLILFNTISSFRFSGRGSCIKIPRPSTIAEVLKILRSEFE